MRKIKFRGKRPNSGKWITGSLVQLFGFSYILNDEHKTSDCSTEVIPETVGQFTGLTDKNGKEIYEGDKLVDEFSGDGYEDPLYYQICYNDIEAKFAIINVGYGHYLGEGGQDCYTGDLHCTDELRDMSEVGGMEIIINSKTFSSL